MFVLGGLGASTLIKSPAQRLAESAPPSPSVITAPLELRVVSDALVTRGLVVAAANVSAIPPQAPSGVQRTLISRIGLHLGDAVRAGQLLIEVSGQPVFALQGRVPAYRDLGPGAFGPDVRQLQVALAGAGLRTGSDPSGTYGSGTSAAVRGLFARAGYVPPGGGTQSSLPSSSIVYVSAFPARVTELAAAIGQDSQTAKITIATGELLVRVDPDAATAGLLREGQIASLTSEILGATVQGRVAGAAAIQPTPDQTSTQIGDGATGSATATGAPGATQSVVIVPDKALTVDWAGQDVRVSVASASSNGKVLAAPVSAVSAGGDGQTSVVVVDTAGAEKRVRVRVGVTGGGYVEIAAIDGSIKPGDRVLVGKAQS